LNQSWNEKSIHKLLIQAKYKLMLIVLNAQAVKKQCIRQYTKTKNPRKPAYPKELATGETKQNE